jgi:hypothetical protein
MCGFPCEFSEDSNTVRDCQSAENANRLGILWQAPEREAPTMTPTGRTLQYLRRLGFVATVVERWLPRVRRRRDAFGADVLAAHPGDGVVLLVQCTTGNHLAHRLDKARQLQDVAAWLRAGGKWECWGWSLRAGRWHVRRVALRPDDLAPFLVEAPPRRRPRRGERQRGLFDTPAPSAHPPERTVT